MKDFSKQDLRQSIGSRFEKIANESPDRMALQSESQSLTYIELNHRANAVAHELLHHAGEKLEPLILLLENPIHHVTGQIGALKARKACIPLDVAFPIARQKEILSASQAQLILTEEKHFTRAHLLATEKQLVLSVDHLAVETSSDNPNLAIKPDSLAYVLYTSGSTGRPKGAMQSHQNLLRVAMVYNEMLGIGASDRVTSPTSLSYTGTLWTLLGSLMNGAAYVCTGFESPALFLNSLAHQKVTVAQMLVTLLRQLMRALDQPVQIPDLRVVFTGGETLLKADVKRFVEIFSGVRGLVYNFGSTEAGIISYLPVDLKNAKEGKFQQEIDDPVFPSGKVVDDAEVLFLDASGNEAPKDGEIAVRSAYLSEGYWKEPELTQKYFSKEKITGKGPVYLTGDLGRLRSDGCLLHLGRKDSQIKVRGYRVNLDEIEEALCSIPGIASSAVRATNDQDGKTQLIAYIQRDETCDLSFRDLRKFLSEVLPIYMMPASFVELDHIPVTGSGKLDRRALPDVIMSRPVLDVPFIEPRTATEKILCEFLRETMNIQSIGVKDNFFELGGDSMTAFQVIGKIKRVLHLDLPPRAIFDAPVIEDLARMIDAFQRINELE